MNLVFEDSRLEGVGALERHKIIATLAQILMQATGVVHVIEFAARVAPAGHRAPGPSHTFFP
jgi:hypothetical protein